jgi:hypothetical protein
MIQNIRITQAVKKQEAILVSILLVLFFILCYWEGVYVLQYVDTLVREILFVQGRYRQDTANIRWLIVGSICLFLAIQSAFYVWICTRIVQLIPQQPKYQNIFRRVVMVLIISPAVWLLFEPLWRLSYVF